MEEAKRKAKANWKLPLRGEEGGMSLSRRRLTPGNSEKAEKKAERANGRVPRADWRSARIEGHCAMLRGYCSHGQSSGGEQVHCNFLQSRGHTRTHTEITLLLGFPDRGNPLNSSRIPLHAELQKRRISCKQRGSREISSVHAVAEQSASGAVWCGQAGDRAAEPGAD